jgi:TonB family protein
MNINRRMVSGMLAVALSLSGTVLVFSQEKQPGGGAVFVRSPQPAQGPESPQAKEQPIKIEGHMQGTMQRNDNFFYVATEMSFDGKLVKGAPYSGQGVTEVVQILSDGNRIVNRSTTMIYRDSEGRTRKESTLRTPFGSSSEEPPVTIFISDPVGGTTYVLDTKSHVARKMPSYRFEWKATAGAAGAPAPATPRAATVASALNAATAPAAPAAPTSAAPATQTFQVAVPTVVPMPPGAAGQGEGRTTFMLRTPEGGDAAAVGQYRREENRRAQSESLGKQSVEGVEAEGTRETITIPAGEIGNERAIEIVNERWYSTELQTVIKTRHSDPRFGETIYRLTNINRGEQPKTLFEVPGDYIVKATTVVGSGVGGGMGPGMAVGTGGGSGGGAGASVFATSPTPALRGIINGGVLNGKAISLPLPETPAIARSAKASGAVAVNIVIDEEGNVISANVESGHPLLRAAAVAAAREAKFSPTKLSGQPVKVQGVLIYNFENQ